MEHCAKEHIPMKPKYTKRENITAEADEIILKRKAAWDHNDADEATKTNQ